MDIEYEGGLAMDTEIDDPMNTEMKPSQIKPPQHKGGPKAGLKTVKKILTQEVQFPLSSSVFFSLFVHVQLFTFFISVGSLFVCSSDKSDKIQEQDIQREKRKTAAAARKIAKNMKAPDERVMIKGEICSIFFSILKTFEKYFFFFRFGRQTIQR